MSFTIWTPRAVASEAFIWSGSPWRVVEAQHVASTMKLVDSQEEQDLLEALLENSKPPLPAAADGLDYLLFTPFRYPPSPTGSRFRAVTDPGVFYGAETVRTACAELGYWRWRFFSDAVQLDRIDPVPHTAFQADIRAQAVDLRKSPFDADAAAWTHPTDYGPTQAFGRVAREAEITAILYLSVRDPDPAWCLAALEPDAFSSKKPRPETQTWWLDVNRDRVIWRRDMDTTSFEFTAAAWRQRVTAVR